jgi:TetR/AcrR family transcriptional regulator, transcriptional repressor for nem operon
MTDSARTGGKRERLIESARSLLHEQGAAQTTIAEVAERARIPAGNVYYYFKTKDELITAVLDSYASEAAGLIETLEAKPAPQDRLKALVRNWDGMRDVVASHGCPMGSLCSELDKSESGLDRKGADVLRLIVDWAEGQFRQLGRRDARDLALALFSGIQGAALLANTFHDPEILRGQTRYLERWIDSLT